MRRAGPGKQGRPPNLERRMPDKNPDAGPSMGETAPETLLRHSAPPGLKRWGKTALVLAIAIAVAGIGWRLWQAHVTAAWTDDQDRQWTPGARNHPP